MTLPAVTFWYWSWRYFSNSLAWASWRSSSFFCTVSTLPSLALMAIRLSVDMLTMVMYPVYSSTSSGSTSSKEPSSFSRLAVSGRMSMRAAMDCRDLPTA